MGPPVPATIALSKEFRQSLPPSLVEALDRIGDQIQVEILDPLLCADAKQLAGTFERVFPKFRDYYLSTVLIMWGFLEEDSQRFSALAIRSFQEPEVLIRSHAARWIGREAALGALQGLTTMIRVAKAGLILFDRNTAPAQTDQPRASAWSNSVIACVLALSPVLAALTDLTNERTTSARLGNVAALAHWSRSYAIQAYHLTKELGVLRTARPDMPIGRSDEEDSALAEAGLETYAEVLHQDDQV
jgi:hypothetical protein